MVIYEIFFLLPLVTFVAVILYFIYKHAWNKSRLEEVEKQTKERWELDRK